jgi:hypothetical protein
MQMEMTEYDNTQGKCVDEGPKIKTSEKTIFRRQDDRNLENFSRREIKL